MMEYSGDDYRSSKPDYEGWFENDLEDEKIDLSDSYNADDFISGPIRVENGTVPIDILEFYHSYAYDCQRYFNLCVVDPDTIIFASGNLIHFFNPFNGNLWFRRCSTGSGIGHITKNPSKNHIAVGENGPNPPIIIYEWPSMKIVTVLREGTTGSYAHLAYSPDGRLLVSQGGDPDYMITVWNWKKSRILLHCKSHGQDIYNAMFSPTVPGHLTTSGAGHIKFWKMARTFTGLKLQGELGRFGKTEISDIVGVYSMPDEKVISGCEWGNILLWDEDLIKLEVCKKNRKPCHGKFITQFEYLNGELVSIGMDGWIRIWYYETIDQADPSDEDRFLENEPIYEFQIKDEGNEDEAMLMSIKKQDPDDPEQNLWYAQDGNGGLWLIELGTFEQPKENPRKLLTCHAGPITWMDVSTWGPFVATCGQDGRLHIYNYSTRRLILVKKFRDKGSRVIWLPCSVEATGSTLVSAFESGVLRVLTLAVLEANESDKIYGDYSRLIQAIKPHKLPITAMSLNPSSSLLVTGSEDCTIFVFSIKTTETYPNLVPIGHVKLFSGISCMTWKPDETNTILVGCSLGDCAEVTLPDEPQNYTKISYELVECRARCFKFQSVKSKIRRELARLAIEKAKEAERDVKREKMMKLRMDNPGIEINEEEFLMDIDEDFPLPEIHIPKVPNRVLMANYTVAGTIWLSMGGYDAGYIYEYPIPEITGSNLPMEPIRSTMIFDADDTEIASCLFYKNNKYLFLGMQKGEIRVCRVNRNDHTDFTDYLSLPMHEPINGFIPKIALSYDGKVLLSCGHDGNLFSYNINDETPHLRFETENPEPPRLLPSSNVEDIDDPDHLILEEVIVKLEDDRIAAAAKRKKSATLNLLRNLTEEYRKIVERNSNLPQSQRIPQEELELDPRITADLDNYLKGKMDLVRKKLAFEVEKSRLGLQKLLDYFIAPITCLPFAVCRISKPDTMVHSLRERKLGDDFTSAYNDVLIRVQEITKTPSEDPARCENESTGEIPDVSVLETLEEEDEKREMEGLEGFIKGQSPNTIEHRLGCQINQILRKYRARKEKIEGRAKEWKKMQALKPDPETNHPDDVAAIEYANNTIGDYKLKVSPDFKQSQEQRETAVTKYKQLLDCRKKTHYLREDFNCRLRAVRDKKLSLESEVLGLIAKLKEIHAEIPEKEIKPFPIVPEIDYNMEFPEKNLELEKYVTMAERVEATKRKKMSITEQIIINPMDEEYEVLLLDEKLIKSELDGSINNLQTTISPDKIFKSRISVSSETLKSLNAIDRAETPWEREMKRLRVMKKINEQDSILKHVEKSYRDLDKELDKLERERLNVTADSVYSDLFLLTLHQELIVLKDFESMENLLARKVAEKTAERDKASRKIQSTSNKIDQRNKEIVKLHGQIKDHQTQFSKMINDNKFADFLRRIFKKKFKLPKNDDDDSSSSSSSDSSSDDDQGSIASDDIGLLHLNESICPAGCDQELYKLAFSMREERYEGEHHIKEAQKVIESLRKEVDADTKKLKLVDNELKANQNDLQNFMREKQRKLNDIDMTVILKFHQLQHFIDDHNVAKIRDCVVFDKTKLSQLYTRVGELQQETFEQKEKHKKNRTHLHRMKIDCDHMNAEIKRLKDDIRQEMIQKFGREVSLDGLYEAVLRRMIYDVKADIKELTKEFDKKIRCVKDKYYQQIDVLETLIQENTEKLNLLAILEGEQSRLKKILKHPPESEENILQIESGYKEDLERLENILKNQRQQKELFRNDIRNLRLKTRPLAPICAGKGINSSGKDAKKNDEEEVISLISLDGDSEGEMAIGATKRNSEDGEQMEDEESQIIVNVEEKDEKKSHTAAMMHGLLLRMMEGTDEENETEGVNREILKRVMEDLPIGGGIEEMREGLERSVDKIIADLPQEDEETMEAMREAIQESLQEIVSRFEDVSQDYGTSSSNIGWNVKQKIMNLMDSMGIKSGNEIEINLIEFLKSDDGIEAAVNYLFQNVHEISDGETIDVLREHAFRTLTEIREEIGNNGVTNTTQEEKPSVTDEETGEDDE